MKDADRHVHWRLVVTLAIVTLFAMAFPAQWRITDLEARIAALEARK